MEKEKGRFDEISLDILTPIMRKVDEVAFHCIYADSELVPLSIHDDVLEKLEEIIDHLKKQTSYFESASLIGYALGKDGSRPGEKYRHMTAIAQAMRDLIKARNDQVKDEMDYMLRNQKNEQVAAMMGF
jgi:hypothetical protein